ncbi:hypothetical protein EI94DRAFT_1818964, partial [Lactarius quietus]
LRRSSILKAFRHAFEGALPQEEPQSRREKGGANRRLEDHDAVSGVSGASHTTQNDDSHALSPELAEKGACELQQSFECAAQGEDGGDGNAMDGSNEVEDAEGDDDAGGTPGVVDTATPVVSGKAWVDDYILRAWQKGGCQMENSVLSLWKQWVPGAIAAGIIPDVIVDADHSMAYLKYAATHWLLTTTGQDKDNRQRLSSASLKKVMTMLGRVRHRQVDDDRALDTSRPASSNRSSEFYKALMVEAQHLQLEDEDFDVCENTILDSQLFPEHFEQVTKSIFSGLDQLPSIIKAHFSWTWQCTTLNRGDELVNLLLSCLQPFQLCVPEHMPINGRRPGLGHYFFGVLSLYHETKVPKPGVKLMFGKTVGKPCSPDTLWKMYTTFLEATTIKSMKKLHLACRTMPTVLEEMGVTMDEIDGIGHWASNTHRDVYAAKIPKSAVVALAGFYVGEAYHVPWAGIPVPGKLQTMLFPFVENALANLKAGPQVNQGVVNFLELLQQLRPFFWRASGAIHEHFPDCSLFRCMKVFANPEARSFLDAWPGLVSGTERELEAEAAIAATFSEASTQTAFMSLAVTFLPNVVPTWNL